LGEGQRKEENKYETNNVKGCYSVRWGGSTEIKTYHKLTTGERQRKEKEKKTGRGTHDCKKRVSFA